MKDCLRLVINENLLKVFIIICHKYHLIFKLPFCQIMAENSEVVFFECSFVLLRLWGNRKIWKIPAMGACYHPVSMLQLLLV